jgi:hypothetical protein
MQHVIAQAARVTKIGQAKVLRYRPEAGDLLIEAGVGWSAGVVGKRNFECGLSLAGGTRLPNRCAGRD